MEPVYRSAKLLREQLKAGAALAEFNGLRGKFATELSIIKDRMQAEPKTARLLQPHFSAYGSALDAYSLVGDVWEYDSAMDAYIGPKPDYPSPPSSPEERLYSLELDLAHINRIARWVELESATKARQALRQRSDSLHTQCGPDVDFNRDCLIRYADQKLAAAEKLLMGR